MTVIVAASREELTSQMVQSRHSQREKSLTAYSAFHDKFQQCKETNLVGGLQIYKVGAESPPSVRISDASSSTSNESEVKLSLSGPSIGTYQIESRLGCASNNSRKKMLLIMDFRRPQSEYS